MTSIYFVHNMWQTYSKNAVIVTTESNNFPIHEVKFPGVALCNMNKISKRKAIEFAMYL